MQARLILLASLGALLLGLLAPSLAFASPAKRIYAGVYLHDVTKFDQKDGVFDVDLELWAKWLGDFDPDKITIGNASEVERTLVGTESDGTWHSARWRVRGTLRGEFPVHRFPFDRQTLAVVLELPDRDGELVPDLAGSGMRERFSVTGWLYEPSFVPRVAEETYRSDLGSIEGEGRPTSVRRAAFEVTLHRPLLTAATKLFLPLVVILFVALVALFVHPKALDVRSGVGVTALLACFAFHFAVADTMPSVAYITLADVLFLISYALTAALLFVSVVAYWLHERGRERAWKRLDAGAVVALPLALALAAAVVALGSPEEAARIASPVHGPRPISASARLRIGTNTLPPPFVGLGGRATSWGTVRTELDGTRFPVLVEEVPSITSESLRFLADGKLEVTWRLRPELRWSDGAPLTADDLRFALEVSPDPRVVEIRVLGPRELKVRFGERVAAALEGIVPLPRHVLGAEFERGGFEAVRAYRRARATPVAGPYRIAEFLQDERLVLEQNPHFVGPPPSIARVEIKRYPDDASLVAAFEAGEVDMIAPNAISPEAARSLAERRPGAVTVRPSELQLFLQPDLSHPLLGRLPLRRALLAAIDRERMRQELFGEAAPFATVSHVPVPGPLPEGAEAVALDREQARRVLEAEGAKGAKIPLFRGRTPFDRAVAARLVQDLADAGIAVDVKEVPNTFDLYRSCRHGGLLLHTTTGERDAEPLRFWTLPQVDGKFDRASRSDAYDDAIALLVDREARALYPERREQIRDALFAAYSRRLPNLPLLFLADRIAAAPALEGWEAGSGNRFGTTVERWHFAPAAAETRPASGR